MTTSQATSFLSEIIEGQAIPYEKLAYFRERLKNRLYSLVLAEFLRQQEDGLTKAELTRRIRRKPEQVSRWLGTPGNWRIETASDLLIGMGAELDMSVAPLAHRGERNFVGPDWLQAHPSHGESVVSFWLGEDEFSTESHSSNANNVIYVDDQPLQIELESEMRDEKCA